MSMYCPQCFSNTLVITSKGVIDIYINGIKRDNGRILFSTEAGDFERTKLEFAKKCDEFFQWYSQFQNKNTIEIVELITPDVKCQNGCRFSPMDKFSAVDVVFKREFIAKTLEDLAAKYRIAIKLKE